jgi:hypothetical protein
VCQLYHSHTETKLSIFMYRRQIFAGVNALYTICGKAWLCFDVLTTGASGFSFWSYFEFLFVSEHFPLIENNFAILVQFLIWLFKNTFRIEVI